MFLALAAAAIALVAILTCKVSDKLAEGIGLDDLRPGPGPGPMLLLRADAWFK